MPAGTARMCVDDHLPGRFEYGRRAEALPIVDIEGTIHFAKAGYVTKTVRINSGSVPQSLQNIRLTRG